MGQGARPAGHGGGTGRCPLVVVDTFVYRDESHVAESCAEALTPVLRRELKKPGMLGG